MNRKTSSIPARKRAAVALLVPFLDPLRWAKRAVGLGEELARLVVLSLLGGAPARGKQQRNKRTSQNVRQLLLLAWSVDDGGFGFSGIHLLVELIVARVAVTGLVGRREARIVRRRSDLCARANALAHEARVVASSRRGPERSPRTHLHFNLLLLVFLLLLLRTFGLIGRLRSKACQQFGTCTTPLFRRPDVRVRRKSNVPQRGPRPPRPPRRAPPRPRTRPPSATSTTPWSILV